MSVSSQVANSRGAQAAALDPPSQREPVEVSSASTIDARPSSAPFAALGRLDRALPFAVVAVVAEASVLLPPGPQSSADLAVSTALLAAVIGSFWLPWARLPSWSTVLVPVAYTGSILALILATGQSASGIGIVLLVPLVWTALFHRRRDSAFVVVAVVIVEIITALTPIHQTDAVIARRCFLWSALGALISVAIHSLREHTARAHREALALEQRLRDVAVLADRDRIGVRLHQSTVQRISSVGLYLEGTKSLIDQPVINERVTKAVSDLDDTVRELRLAVFDLESEPTLPEP